MSKSHPPDLGHPDSAEAAVQPLDVMRLHSDLPKPFVHTGLAPLRATVCALEEVLHGLCEVPQRLLLHRLTPGAKPRILGAGLRQLRTLLQIARSLASALPMLLLLDGQIPHVPRISAVGQQCLFLLRGRQQPEPRHTRTLTTDTDIRGPAKLAPVRAGLLLSLKSAVFCSRRLL
jgi:hypothetical protein